MTPISIILCTLVLSNHSIETTKPKATKKQMRSGQDGVDGDDQVINTQCTLLKIIYENLQLLEELEDRLSYSELRKSLFQLLDSFFQTETSSLTIPERKKFFIAQVDSILDESVQVTSLKKYIKQEIEEIEND